MADTETTTRAEQANFERNQSAPRIIDISLDLDAETFQMRSYAGFKKNMEFDVEVIKDYPGGLGQIVRGVHMRLHAGSHIDAPSHMLKGGIDIHEVPLAAFMGDTVLADVRHRGGHEAITVPDLEATIGDLRPGERVLLRTDVNETYDGSPEWIARSPFLDRPAVDWLAERGARNVVMEIGNEVDLKFSHEIIEAARGDELIKLAQSRSEGRFDTPAKRLLVSTSLAFPNQPTDAHMACADFLLLHGNATHHPDSVRLLVSRYRANPAYRGQPLVFNEDDHFDFDKPDNNMLAAIEMHAGWGYFDYRMSRENYEYGFQSLPVDWSISTDRKKGFFNLLKQVTGK